MQEVLPFLLLTKMEEMLDIMLHHGGDFKEAYKETYNHPINPIPGQPLWEKAEEYNRPHAPKIKKINQGSSR
ncbi:hypothetical protein AHAS_Ahas02G0176600 [Arachis hypogaea]